MENRKYYRLSELTGLAYTDAFHFVEFFYKRSRFYNEARFSEKEIECLSDAIGFIFDANGVVRHGGEF